MLVSPEHLYFQNAGNLVRTKTLGPIWSVNQSGILDRPEEKFFLEGLLMLVSPEHLYFQNAGSLVRTKTLGHIWGVSQSGTSVPAPMRSQTSIQTAGSLVRSKTLGPIWSVNQSGILDRPEEKNFLEGLLMLVSPEHLYFQNAGSLVRTNTLGHIWGVSQSRTSVPFRMLVV